MISVFQCVLAMKSFSPGLAPFDEVCGGSVDTVHDRLRRSRRNRVVRARSVVRASRERERERERRLDQRRREKGGISGHEVGRGCSRVVNVS
jgi:hypothetical protein